MTRRPSSSKPREGDYPAKARFTLAEAPGLRVRQLSLAAGQSVPWHFHSEITDTFFCMKDPMCVKTRDPMLNSFSSLATPSQFRRDAPTSPKALKTGPANS
jgi:hypothetical protein